MYEYKNDKNPNNPPKITKDYFASQPGTEQTALFWWCFFGDWMRVTEADFLSDSVWFDIKGNFHRLIPSGNPGTWLVHLKADAKLKKNTSIFVLVRVWWLNLPIYDCDHYYYHLDLLLYLFSKIGDCGDAKILPGFFFHRNLVLRQSEDNENNRKKGTWQKLLKNNMHGCVVVSLLLFVFVFAVRNKAEG